MEVVLVLAVIAGLVLLARHRSSIRSSDWYETTHRLDAPGVVVERRADDGDAVSTGETLENRSLPHSPIAHLSGWRVVTDEEMTESQSYFASPSPDVRAEPWVPKRAWSSDDEDLSDMRSLTDMPNDGLSFVDEFGDEGDEWDSI